MWLFLGLLLRCCSLRWSQWLLWCGMLNFDWAAVTQDGVWIPDFSCPCVLEHDTELQLFPVDRPGEAQRKGLCPPGVEKYWMQSIYQGLWLLLWFSESSFVMTMLVFKVLVGYCVQNQPPFTSKYTLLTVCSFQNNGGKQITANLI